ncbi:MAG TPA: sulfotransferase [Acidimicrobiales bacterium]|nr:sulfotransferase [Acidimicrobiales bacterium]
MTAPLDDRVRIHDLASPEWSPAARPYVDGLAAYGEELGLDALTSERVRDAAAAQTGLDTWGDPGFGERLDLLCRALRDEAGLSALGLALTYESLVQTLRGRLLVEDLVARHPEIEQVPIERPIVICGLPRTGTTHLHNLLSADPALRHLPYWESLEPVLPPEEAAAAALTGAGFGGPDDPRRERTQMAVDLVDTCMPLFKRMHEMTVDHAHEEIQLLALDIGGMFFETTAPMPSWRQHYTTTDQTPSYRYLRRVLQALTWLRPEAGSRWVLKSPQHLEQLGPLAATFPDATFVITHRDPVAVTASTCTMLAYTARLRMAHPDPRAIGAYWSSRVEELLLGGLRDRDRLPADSVVDVVLDDFVADEDATVRRIYSVADQPLGDDAWAAMAAFVATHPRGRHGTIAYDLEALGIDAPTRRAALAPYTARHALRDEGL